MVGRSNERCRRLEKRVYSNLTSAQLSALKARARMDNKTVSEYLRMLVERHLSSQSSDPLQLVLEYLQVLRIEHRTAARLTREQSLEAEKFASEELAAWYKRRPVGDLPSA